MRRNGAIDAGPGRTRPPTAAGAAWMIAQALVGAGFAELQLAGLWRAER